MPSCYYLFKSQSAKSRYIESGRLVLLSSEAREPPFSGIHYKAKLQSHSSRIGTLTRTRNRRRCFLSSFDHQSVE